MELDKLSLLPKILQFEINQYDWNKYFSKKCTSTVDPRHVPQTCIFFFQTGNAGQPRLAMNLLALAPNC